MRYFALARFRACLPRLRVAALATALACSSIGCASAPLSVRPVRQTLDLRLDPATSQLEATSATELTVEGSPRRGRVDLLLHPDLVVTSVKAEGATLAGHRTLPPKKDEGDAITPATLRLQLQRPAAEVRLDIAYQGKLWQDVAAGEKEGQVHNFAVQAHVGKEGVYLEPAGYWYPQIELGETTTPDERLTHYELTTDPIEGFELVAGLEAVRDQAGAAPDAQPGATSGRLHWRSPFPLDGLVLLGGPLERSTGSHGGIQLNALLAPGKAAVGEDLLAASAEVLDRYQPLIGSYPYRDFTVLEAFFSSGFAFPTCTQIAGSQLSEHKQYRRHGYLDHELLHNWWGNGVFVDPGDGNWCEALTTYLANYAGHVLDGDAEGARKQRRNYSSFLSALPAEDDKPLGTFGHDGGAGRGIGYEKGAAVFHMLERKIGREAFFAGLRLLTAEQMGRHIGWEVIRAAMERASGQDLAPFFQQWVRQGGAPRLELAAADWQPGEKNVRVTLQQGETAFALDVPLRLHYGERWVDAVVKIDQSSQQVEVPCEASGLTAVELDPDYHLFRKLRPEQMLPTSALTRRAKRLVIVLPDGDVAAPYRMVADSYRRAVLGEDPSKPAPDREVLERTASTLAPADLKDAGVLVLGEAVRAPAVQELLGRTRSPVRWLGTGFQVDERPHAASGEAIYFTVHHPERPGQGITVYYGNSEQALANAGLLNFYPNSLLVFEIPAAVEGSDAPRAKVIERIDFEGHDRIDF